MMNCPKCDAEIDNALVASSQGASLVCPSCGARLSFVRKAPPPVRDGVFLVLCPICEEGRVRSKGNVDDEEVYVCDACASVLRENIFGFRYVWLDQKYEKGKSEFVGQTFTRLDLIEMSEQLHNAKEGRIPKGDRAPVPAGEAVSATARPTHGDAAELWWEIDKEELARRKRAADAKKDVTVDDLMDELKRRREGK